MPETLEPSPLDAVVDVQALAVLASIDDLRHDLPASIHDARVALRKLRSTLVVFRPLVDAEVAAALETDLAWFAGELGGARDSQVVRSRITTALHEHGNVADGDALLLEVDGSTAAAWRRAEHALVDPRLKELTVRLEQVRLRGIGADAPVERTVRARVRGALERLVRRAQAIDHESDDDRLHRLRKRVKRVRFAVAGLRDAAVDVLPVGSGVGRVAHALEDLQELLGEYQDAVVTAQLLDRIAARVPALAGLAEDLSGGQRAAAARVRESLPSGVERVRKAAQRLARRAPSA